MYRKKRLLFQIENNSTIDVFSPILLFHRFYKQSCPTSRIDVIQSRVLHNERKDEKLLIIFCDLDVCTVLLIYLSIYLILKLCLHIFSI